MRTIVSNRITIHEPTLAVRNWIETHLTVMNPKFETLMRLGKEAQIRMFHIKKDMYLYVKSGDSYIVPFGCLYSLWPLIREGEVDSQFNELDKISCLHDKITQPLYDYQEEAVQKMVQAKSGILIGGCGSGKTNCAIEIIHRIGEKFLWLTHTKDLVKQTYKRFKSLYPEMDIGITGDGEVNFGRDGTIATIQTMEKLDPDIYRGEFNMVMTDECHHISGSPTLQKMFVKVIEKIPARYKYGITASDKRNDSLTKTMYTSTGFFDSRFEPIWTIKKEDTKTLVAEHRRFDLDTPFSYDMLNPDGTFNYVGLVNYIAENEERNKTIVSNIVSLVSEGRKQLVLCARVEQCKVIHEMLVNSSVNAVLLIGSVTAKRREKILSDHTGWSVIVATVSLAKEGLDIKELDTLHLVSCLGNKSDTVQAAGRIERICPDKKNPIVFDYVDKKIPYLVSRYKKRKTWLANR